MEHASYSCGARFYSRCVIFLFTDALVVMVVTLDQELVQREDNKVSKIGRELLPEEVNNQVVL
jgi:hypothetical protein